MRTEASAPRAKAALEFVNALQQRFADRLSTLGQTFEPVEWLRDGGRHGGGVRLVAQDGVFDRASLNVSQVHYEDLPDKRLASATALSCIVHPAAPHAPSMHMHISWTEMRDGGGYWRVMADLNPSIANEEHARRFAAVLKEAAGETYAEAAKQGDRYFHIPALNRHRGVEHFYLEGYATADPQADIELARRVGEGVIDLYPKLVAEGAKRAASDADIQAQIAYHTLYLFQVLTLDRGTTSGLLVHDQNDVGILGSLPSKVDTRLLREWEDLVPEPQDSLLACIEGALEDGAPGIYPVTRIAKEALAIGIRTHYRGYPEALKLQARGDRVPPTVQNHA